MWWKRIDCSRGRGTSADSRCINSSGDRLAGRALAALRTFVRHAKAAGTTMRQDSAPGARFRRARVSSSPPQLVRRRCNARAHWPETENDAAAPIFQPLAIAGAAAHGSVRRRLQSQRRRLRVLRHQTMQRGLLDVVTLAVNRSASGCAAGRPVDGSHPRRRGGDLGGAQARHPRDEGTKDLTVATVSLADCNWPLAKTR